jgi:hypothetical protein
MDCTNSQVQAVMTFGLRFQAAVIVNFLLVGGWSPCWAQDSNEPNVNSSMGPSCSRETAHLPDTVHIPDELRAPLQLMLKKSATFRRQCRQIADAPLVYVRVRLDWRIDPLLYRARSTIHRSQIGPIVALVDIGVFGSPIEWIAHEFEHLVEQIEGVRLPALSEQTPFAWHSNGDMFETARAIRAGHKVLEEIRAADRLAATSATRRPRF